MINEMLFKRDSKGKVRVWVVQVEHDQWRTVSGLQEGKQVTSTWRKADPKNEGKSNETTGPEQAIAESNAEFDKKLRTGYFTSLADVDSFSKFKPMLAADYAKLKKPLSYPVISQPKLDGIRCIARADGLWTRSGKQHLSIPHIWKLLEPIFKEVPDLILDGELYNHDLKDDFNTIVSIVRKAKPSEDDLALSAKLVQFHVYDSLNNSDVEFKHRAYEYLTLARILDSEMMQAVRSDYIEDEIELNTTYESYLDLGYEGQMVRNIDSKYDVGKRSKNLLKRKEFISEEFEVVAVLEGKGNWSGCAKKITIRLPDGTTGEAGCRGTQAEMKELLNGDVPTWATVRFFGYTPEGKLRFGIMIDHGFGQRED